MLPSNSSPPIVANAITAPGSFNMGLSRDDAQGIVEFDGTFLSLSFTVQATNRFQDLAATPALITWLSVDSFPYYQNTGTLVYPFVITGPAAFFIPNLLFMDGLQITINAITGSANLKARTGSFLNSLPTGVAGGLTQNLWLELVRNRIAMSDMMSTDYGAAVAVTDLGKV